LLLVNRTNLIIKLPYTFEARLLEHGHANDGKAKVAAIAAAVSAGTSSVILGSMWAVGAFGSYSSPSGQFALGTAGGLMRAAHAAGDKFAEPVGGVVVRKDSLLIGFRSLAFAVRMVEDKYELVHL